jgi:iron complex transport system ATP-binding protein
VIAFREVVIRYPHSLVNAIDGVSFDVAPGRMTALVGPNGSGKSTLVRALVKRVYPVAGSITVGGSDLRSIPLGELGRRAAVLAQREETAFPLHVEEYVALGRFPHLGLWNARSSADDAAVADAIRRAGIEALASRRTDELSGGEWQQVRLARALAQEAPALVVDEPTTFLDIAHEMVIFELLASLASSGMAVLLVSHQLNLVSRFADEIVLLNKGGVAARGTPADVMNPALLEEVFEWPMSVTTEPGSGRPALVPLRQRNTASQTITEGTEE